MERRKLTKEDIDKVRDIEGFPIGTDEDIIALSDAPYYTACPNPFIEEFIKENGTSYDEETDDYHREPFAADVSEGKSDAIYNAHTYHTKVPYKAIVRYIMHYTDPGDIVLDGFCGTGMTGVAAQKCGNPDNELKYSIELNNNTVKWGARKAILNDLSPIAAYISYNYNKKHDVITFIQEAEEILNKCEKECGWMWETVSKSNLLGDSKVKVNYYAWTDVLICPHCGGEFKFYENGYDKDTDNVIKNFECPHCNASLKKTDCSKKKEQFYDEKLGKMTTIAKQVPVLVCYTENRRKKFKELDEFDNELLIKIENLEIPYWYPTDELVKGYNTEQPKKSHGLTNVHYFYSKRILYFLSKMYDEISKCKEKELLLIWFTSQIINISKLNRYRPKVSFPYNPLSGTLYVSSMICEANPFNAYKGKIKKMAEALSGINEGGVVISNCSTTNLYGVKNNSIDYIFTDPPFGANLNYSELSFLWESWLKVKTNNKCEAIMNTVQNKGLFEYQKLMEKCFREYYRVLKPKHWMTVEFHNSKNSVWNAIQEGLQKAGFIVADVRVLDKQLGTFKQTTSTSAVKQDLVISVYKPSLSVEKSIIEKAGTPDTAWNFISSHLEQLPVVVDKNGKIELLTERQSFLLFDRMVAYHIMKGIPVPIDSNDFYSGLDNRFIKRDGMYFLPDQINEYDTIRIKKEVDNIQLELFVTNEKSAIAWLYQQLDEHNEGPQPYSKLQPKFMKEVKTVDKFESIPELQILLEENFLQDNSGKWYIPDRTKEADIAKLREKNLWKEFEGYMGSKGKLKLFRSEAIRVGFARLWKDKNYQAIVNIAERLPDKTVQEDPNILMYYDISLSRV